MNNSLSLSFNLADDEPEVGYAQRGAISTPPAHAHQPSPALSQPHSFLHASDCEAIIANLPDNQQAFVHSILYEDNWNMWQRGPQNFKIHSRAQLTTLSALDEGRKDAPPLTCEHFIYAACQTQQALSSGSAPRKYGAIQIEWIVNEARKGSEQYVNELFFPDRIVKPFFDIDMPLAGNERMTTPEGVASFIFDFVGYCARVLDYSSDLCDYCWLQCFHPDKISFHVVVNAAVHYASNKHLGAHLTSANFDVRKYYVDMHPYNNRAQLRAPYSGKWDGKTYSPFLIMGKKHTEVTRADIRLALAQCVYEPSNLIDVQLQAALPRQIANEAGFTESLDALKRIYEQDDLSISTKGINTYEVDELLCGCGHRGAFVTVDSRVTRMTMRVQCKQYCAEVELGYTPLTQRYQRQYEFLKNFLEPNHLCRVDVPIYDSRERENPDFRGFGYLELNEYDFCRYQNLEPPAEWIYFYCDPHRGKMFDSDFFNFIRDSGNFDRFDPFDKLFHGRRELLLAYMSLFCAKVSVSDTWMVRTKKGIVSQKLVSVKEVFGACCYEIEKKKGRGPDAEVTILEKPFWPIFEKHGNYSIGSFNNGPLTKLDETSLALPFPKRVDVNRAFSRWMNASEPDKLCLRSLWTHYLKMACEYERSINPDVAKLARDFLERWTLSVMFDTYTPTRICPVFSSSGGGQGKSSLPNFIASFLGSDNSTMGRSATELLKAQFNGGCNNFTLLDEIFMDMPTVERLKEALTAETFKSERKGENATQQRNRRNFIATTNKDVFFAVNKHGRERRFIIYTFLGISVMDELEDGKFFDHQCFCSGAEDLFGDKVPCAEHSFSDHSSFMGCFHGLVTRKEEGGSGEHDQLRSGRLFEQFVGMLYEIYVEKKADWKTSMQSAMPTLAGTLNAQQKVQTHAGKLIQEWVDRGFSFSFADNPDKTGVTRHVRSVDVAGFSAKRSSGVHNWEEYVPKQTLYQLYVEWCYKNGFQKKNVDVFFTDLEMEWMEITGKKLTFNMERSMQQVLRYTQSGGASRPDFENTNAPEFQGVSIYMGNSPAFLTKSNLRRSNSVGEVARPSPAPARVPVADIFRRQSVPGQSANFREATPPIPMPENSIRRMRISESTLGAAADAEEARELRRERQEQSRDLSAARRAWNLVEQEDARDGFDPDRANLRRARAEPEPEEEDVGMMTFLAAEADRDASRREKRARFAGIDLDAIEGEEEEEEIPVGEMFGGQEEDLMDESN